MKHFLLGVIFFVIVVPLMVLFILISFDKEIESFYDNKHSSYNKLERK